MKNYAKSLILLSSLSLLSCAALDRRDFEAQMDPMRADDPLFMPNEDFTVVAGDEGRYYRSTETIRERTPATARVKEQSRYKTSLKRELINLENRLDDAEYQEYLKIREKLGSDSERIYFLGLSTQDRREYLSIRRIEAPRYYTVRESQMAAYQSEIILGMRKTDVIQSWGQPDRRDYSGDPRYQNERWAYSRNGKVKYVYFEGGLVGGWTNQ